MGYIASHPSIHLAIHFASSETIVSLVNHEADCSGREGTREGIVTVSGHCGGYYGRDCGEHCGEANRAI